MRYNLKETKHNYKDFVIVGSQRSTSGGYVLGGRHYVEGGITRNYHVIKDGKYFFNPNNIIERLKDAKEQIDDYLARQQNKNKNELEI